MFDLAVSVSHRSPAPDAEARPRMIGISETFRTNPSKNRPLKAREDEQKKKEQKKNRKRTEKEQKKNRKRMEKNGKEWGREVAALCFC
jgi:hypothetical protein